MRRSKSDRASSERRTVANRLLLKVPEWSSRGCGNRAPKGHRGAWMRRLGLGVIVAGLAGAALFVGSWWLTGTPWPLAGWRWLEPKLEQIEPAPVKSALDRSAFARARRADTERAYQRYLDHCAAHGCTFRSEAEARMMRLQLSTEQAERNTRLQRRAADLDAYSDALKADTESAGAASPLSRRWPSSTVAVSR